MSKAGERLISAAKELLDSLRNDEWVERRTAKGVLVFTPKTVIPPKGDGGTVFCGKDVI